MQPESRILAAEDIASAHPFSLKPCYHHCHDRFDEKFIILVMGQGDKSAG